METRRAEPAIMTYLHRKGRQLGVPVAGTFELTARCNFHCPMCYVHMTEEQIRQTGRELTADQWLRIADEARKEGMLLALLTGGEPLMRKDFFDIYRGMKQMGLMICVNSNGSMLRGKVLEQLLQDPPFRLNISLYGGSNETYQNMCGLPVYDTVRENIRTLRQAGVEVALNLSVTPYNCRDLERIYADARELDVNVKASTYMYPPVRINGQQFGCGNRFTPEEAARWAYAWDQLRFTPEDFCQRNRNICALQQEEEPDCMIEADEGVRCRAGATSFWVTWDGKMLPCGMMTHPVADLLEEGFRQAWQTIRQQTAALRLPGKCTVCPKRPVCSVCAAVCQTETGSFDAVPEYLCRQVDETIRLCSEHCGKET